MVVEAKRTDVEARQWLERAAKHYNAFFKKAFRLRHAALFLFISLSLSCFAPHSVVRTDVVSPAERPAFLEALSDFYFVGSGNDDPSLVAPHGMKGAALPSQFKVGQQYIFHRRHPTDNYDLFNVLQKRFRSHGATVHAAEGNLERFVGGLAFRISFEDGNYKGAIHNTLDGQIVNNEALGKEWSFDDYILTFEKVDGAN